MPADATGNGSSNYFHHAQSNVRRVTAALRNIINNLTISGHLEKKNYLCYLV